MKMRKAYYKIFVDGQPWGEQIEDFHDALTLMNNLWLQQNGKVATALVVTDDISSTIVLRNPARPPIT